MLRGDLEGSGIKLVWEPTGEIVGEIIDVRSDVRGLTITIKVHDPGDRAPGAKHTNLCMAQKQWNPYICICG